MSEKQIFEKLESIIDAVTLSDLVDMLVTICDEKADHIRSSYDDDETAKFWDNASSILARAADEIEV